LRRGLAAPARLFAVWRARAPDRLVIAPQDLRTADPIIAEDIYGGFFVFHGKAVNTHGESPFLVESPSPAWTQALMGFGWLRHLRAAGAALSRANARALVDDWIRLCGRPPASDPGGRQAHEAGWDAAVVARRLMSWLSQSPLLLEGADRPFYRRFVRSIGRQAAWLNRVLNGGLTGEARLAAAIALAELALCVEGLPRLQRRAQRGLVAELEAQILGDGGHIGRNPATIVETLLDLLPLRQAYAARGAEAPPQLLNAIDRMLPMLRMMRHGDGSLALFNGMGVTRPEILATLLAYDDAGAGVLRHAPHSGYVRLESEHALVIADVGGAPPRDFSSDGCAGALSFELSSGAQRLVVNCGAPERSRAPMREAARQTAAHSTLVIGDVSSCRFAPTQALSAWLDAQIIAGPRIVDLTRASDGLSIAASHDGYRRRFGLLHRRALWLSPAGLVGEDELLGAGAEAGASPPEHALRFHLHPAVRPSIAPGGEGIVLTPPDGPAWLFTCDAPAMIEESVLFAAPNGPRASEQIVVARDKGATGPIRWAFARLEG